MASPSDRRQDKPAHGQLLLVEHLPLHRQPEASPQHQAQQHGQHHPQAQIHQIRHGKEGHVPGASQHAVGDHLQADKHIEPAHEPGAGHTRLKGHRRAPVLP